MEEEDHHLKPWEEEVEKDQMTSSVEEVEEMLMMIDLGEELLMRSQELRLILLVTG